MSAARSATYGHLAPADVVVGLVGVILMVSGGYCAGAMVGHWAAAPAIGVAAFVLLALPMPALSRPTALFLPVRHVGAIARFELSIPTTVYTVIGASAVVWLLAVAAHAWRSRGSVISSEALRDLGLVMGATATLVVVAFVWRPEFYVVDRSAVPRCSEVAGVSICMHPAFARSDKDVHEVVERLNGSGLGSMLTRVTDESVLEADRPAPGEAVVSLSLTPLDSGFAVRAIPDQLASQIVEGVLMQNCSGKPRTALDANSALARRTLVSAGFPEATGLLPAVESDIDRRVAAMDAATLQAFMAKNKTAVAACTLTEISAG